MREMVCVLTCVEPCRTFEIYRDRDWHSYVTYVRLK